MWTTARFTRASQRGYSRDVWQVGGMRLEFAFRGEGNALDCVRPDTAAVGDSSMKTIFDQSECQNLKNALGKEWLETNGLGGFASSTIIGANTRRQHGLLIAVAASAGGTARIAREIRGAGVNRRTRVLDCHKPLSRHDLPARFQYPDGVSSASVADVSVRGPRF